MENITLAPKKLLCCAEVLNLWKPKHAEMSNNSELKKIIEDKDCEEVLSVLFHSYDNKGEKLYVPREVREEIQSVYDKVKKEWPQEVLKAVEENPEEAFHNTEPEPMPDSGYSGLSATDLAYRFLFKHSDGKIYTFSHLNRFEWDLLPTGDYLSDLFGILSHVVYNKSRKRLAYLQGVLESNDRSFNAILAPYYKLTQCYDLLSDEGIAVTITGASWLYDNKVLADLLDKKAIEAVISLPDSISDRQDFDDWGTEIIIVNKRRNEKIKFFDLSTLNTVSDREKIFAEFDNILGFFNKQYVREIPCQEVAKHNTFDPYYYLTGILFADDTIVLSEIARKIDPSRDGSGEVFVDYRHQGYSKDFPKEPLPVFYPFNETLHDEVAGMCRYHIDVPAVFYTTDGAVAYYSANHSFLYVDGKRVDFPRAFTTKNLFTDAAVLTTRDDGNSYVSQVGYKGITKYDIGVKDPESGYTEYFDFLSNEYLISILIDEQTYRQVNIRRRRFYGDAKALNGPSFAGALMDFKVKRRDCDQILEYIEQAKHPRVNNVCNIIVVGENNEQIEKAIKFDGKLNIVNCQTEREVKSQLGNLDKDFHAVVFNVTGKSDPETELKDIVRCVNASGKKSFFVTMSSEKLEGSFPKNGQYWYPFTDLALICPIFALNDSNDQLKFSEKIVESTLSSTDNEINKRFGDVLDCINDNQEGYRVYKEIVGSLLFPEKYDIDAYLYFNKLRSLVEDVFRKMNSLGYLDDRFFENNAVNMTDSYKYLTGQVTGTKTGKVQYGKDRKSVFPPLLCNILRQLIEVGNIGSHSDGYYDEISEDEFNDYCKAQGYYEAKNSLLLLQSLALQLGTVIKYVDSLRECNPKVAPEYSGERFLDEFSKSYTDGKLRDVTLLQDSGVVYARMQLLKKDVLIKTPFTSLKDNENVILENFRVNTDKESRAKYPLFAYVDKTGKKQ